MTALTSAQRKEIVARRQSLSPREKEIAELLRLGLSNREIGARMFVTEKTIKTHISNMFRFMKVDSRFKLILKLAEIDATREKTSADVAKYEVSR